MKQKKLLFVVNHSEFFFSHRLPFALGAQKKGFEVHVATSPSGMEDRYVSYGLVWHKLSLQRGVETPEADLLLFLDVSVEQAKRRNRLRKKANKETDEEIELRHKVNTILTFKVSNHISIDANCTYEQVLKEIKRRVWDEVSLKKIMTYSQRLE
jgi:hypothetical protein